MKFNIIYYLASFLTAFLAFFFIAPTPVSAACNVGFCPDPASTFTHVYGYGGPLDWSELNCIHAELRDDTVPNYVSATSCTMSVVNGKLFIDLAFPAFFSNYSHNYRVTVTENAHSYDSVKFQFTQFDIHDKTSNGNDLTNHNGVLDFTSSLPSVVNDTHAASMAAGTSQYLTATDSASWKPSSNISLEAWVYFKSLPGGGNYPVIISNISTTNGYGWDWFYDGDTGKIRFYINTGSGSFNATSNTTVTTGTWHHYAVTYDGAIVKFYLDGVADGTSSQSIALGYESGQNPAIGAGYFGGWGRFINANIDDVRIWNTIRSATDVNNDKAVRLVGNESGLSAYYPFETFKASDLDLTDKTSNGNNLTDHNSVSDVTFDLPNLLSSTNSAGFAAPSSQYLTATDSASWKPSSNISLEAWVYFASLPGGGNYPVIASNISTTNGYGWDWFYDGDTGKIRFYVNTASGSFNASSSTSVSTGTWHHYAVTYDGSTVKFYLDGVADGTSSQSLALGYESGQNPAMGAGYFGGWGRFINANIDDMRIWNTVRTSAQISNNMNSELVGNESGLAAYYPL